MRLGLIARSDSSGVGQGQTLRLARLLNPEKVMLIDSSTFNGSKQHHDWYKKYSPMIINGFPTTDQIAEFLKGIDVVMSVETFYSNLFTSLARKWGVKTILIANWEFTDWNRAGYSYPLPDKIVTPSYWHLSQMKHKYKANYLPTPVFDDEFKQARRANLRRSGRNYLFINGKTAVHDRSGLSSLYEAMHHAKGDFTITVKSQDPVKKHPDPRLIYDFTNLEKQEDLYKGFDALIHPRRYGGQSLVMCEALMSGLPVIMPDIAPNDTILPRPWLVQAKKVGDFMARTPIDIYATEPMQLAKALDTLDTSREAKKWAYEIGQQYEAENLRSKYEELLK